MARAPPILPLEKEPADDNEHITEGVKKGKPLDDLRHIGNGKDKSGKEERRLEEEKGRHNSLLLGGRDGGDEDADAERGKEKEHHTQEEQVGMGGKGKSNHKIPIEVTNII